VRADEADEHDEEEEPTQDGHGPPRQARSLGALLGGEPEARGDNPDSAEQGREVEACRDGFAQAHGVGRECEGSCLVKWRLE
jgi:hypothetical protein